MGALVETDEVGISISVKSPANLHPKYQLELVSLNGIQKTKITELEKIKSQIESKQNDIIILNSKISQITADEELLSNEIIEISEKLDTAIKQQINLEKSILNYNRVIDSLNLDIAVFEHDLESTWVSTIIVTITKEEEPEDKLEISITNMFHLNNVAASIKNEEDAAVSNIDWTFTISGELLGITIESNGAISSLAKGASAVIPSGDVKFTFGTKIIHIVAKVGSESFSETFSCFVLGKFI